MKRFLKKLALFLVVPLAVCASLAFFADKGLRRSCSKLYSEWNDLVDGKINADVLVMGSSRAWVHVSPQKLDSAFNINSYNLGIDGYNFLMQYYRFQLYLKYNRKPRVIIQTLECQALGRRPTLLDYQQFFPYLGEPLMQEAITYYKGMDFKDVYIPLYKYRSDPKVLLYGLQTNFTSSASCDPVKYKGFKAYDQEWENDFEAYKADNPDGVREKLDTLTIRLFDNYLAQCRKENVKVILVYPPEYKEAHAFIRNRDSIVSLYRGFATKYNIPFIDYSNDSLSNSTRYFYNSQHLNARGVAPFNTTLIKDLSSYIEKQ